MNLRYLLSGVSLFVLTTAVAQAQTNVDAEITTESEVGQILTKTEESQSSQLAMSSWQKQLADWELTSTQTPLSTVVELSAQVPETAAPEQEADTPNVAQLSSDITPEEPPAEFTPANPELLDSEFVLDDSMEQVTNVNQLRDVSPADWAYEALRNLVETYGCIAGYPDGTFRGNRAMTRYEFAAGLNACLQQIERLIAASTADFVTKDDLATMQKLMEEFEAELATLGTRVDNLEGRVAFLEDHQFSTTTKLSGEVVFGFATAFGGDPPGGCTLLADGNDVNTDREVDCTDSGDPDNNAVFTHLVRLGLGTSFTGKDRLRMVLTTGNFDDGGFTNPESFNTYMTRLGYQADLGNQVILDQLEYRFPVFDDRVVVSVIPEGFSLSSVITANSPYFDIGRGSISRFGQLSPILRIGGVMNAGAGIDWLIFDQLRLQVAYGTANSSDPDQGIFGSDNSALGVQLLAEPFDNVLAGIHYVNAYSSDGTLGTFTGSVNAETLGLWSGSAIPAPPGVSGSGFEACCRLPVGDLPAQINAVGGSLQWRMAENLTFGAWGGYIFANFLERLPNFPDVDVDGDATPDGIGPSSNKKPFANAATFSVSLGLSDPFGREGDLFAFIFGMPPKLVDAGPETVGVPVPFFERVVRGEEETPVTDNNSNLDFENRRQNVGQEDEATSLHFEFFYRFKISNNIWITPGFFMVTNPGHIEDNDTLYVGTIRTLFSF